MRNVFSYLSLVFFQTILFISCNQKELAKIEQLEIEISILQKKNALLEKELDDLKYGADKMLAQVKNAFDKKEYKDVVRYANALESKHPDTNESKEAMQLSESAKKEMDIAEKKALAEKEAEERRVLSSITKQRDVIEGITWYYDKTVKQISGSKVYAYFGKKDNGEVEPIRFVIRCLYDIEDSLIYITEYVFNIDNSPYRYKPEPFSVKQDMNTDYILEQLDVATSRDREIDRIMRLLSNCTSATLRARGETNHMDRTIRKSEITGLKNIIAAYDYVKAGKLK